MIQANSIPKARFSKPTDVKEFLVKEFPNSESYWGDGIIDPVSKTVISGAGKLGKSNFALNLAISMARGTPFLNISITRKLRVLYMQQEISQKNFQKRLKLILEDVILDDGYFVCNTIRGLNIMNKDHFAELISWLEEKKYDVIIFDPIYKLHNMEENSSKDMKNLTDIFDWIIDQFKVAIILIHHHHKFNFKEGTGSHQLRGSTVLFDWGDSYLILNPTRRKKELKLEWELRNGEDPPSLLLRRNKNLWYEVVKELDEKKGYDTDDIVEIMEQFGKGMPIPQKDIVAKAKELKGISDKTVRESLLPEAMKEGKVKKTPAKGSGVLWTLL